MFYEKAKLIKQGKLHLHFFVIYQLNVLFSLKLKLVSLFSGITKLAFITLD